MGWLLLRRFVKDECAKTKGMLSVYIDQRLSLKELREVEHHLEACQRCQEELDSLRAVVGLLHRMPRVSPSRSFAIAEVKPVPRRTAAWALRAATSVAAVFLVVLFAGDLFNVFDVTPSLVNEGGASSSTSGPEKGEQRDSASLFGLFPPFTLDAWKDFYSSSEEEGPAEEEEPGLPSGGEELAREEAGWLRPLEYSFLGVVVVLGGVTIANWRKEKKLKNLG